MEQLRRKKIVEIVNKITEKQVLSEIFFIMTENQKKKNYSQNSNGIFFNLLTVEEEILTKLVKYLTDIETKIDNQVIHEIDRENTIDSITKELVKENTATPPANKFKPYEKRDFRSKTSYVKYDTLESSEIDILSKELVAKKIIHKGVYGRLDKITKKRVQKDTTRKKYQQGICTEQDEETPDTIEVFDVLEDDELEEMIDEVLDETEEINENLEDYPDEDHDDIPAVAIRRTKNLTEEDINIENEIDMDDEKKVTLETRFILDMDKIFIT